MSKKIAVFRFRVSNATNVCFDSDVETPWYKKHLEELDSEEHIEDTLNDFFERVNNPEIISITPITVHRHNNGRSDTIDLIYTISYDK